MWYFSIHFCLEWNDLWTDYWNVMTFGQTNVKWWVETQNINKKVGVTFFHFYFNLIYFKVELLRRKQTVLSWIGSNNGWSIFNVWTWCFNWHRNICSFCCTGMHDSINNRSIGTKKTTSTASTKSIVIRK